MKKFKDNANLLKLGSNIRKQRNKLGMTQEILSFEAGLDRSYVGGAERGERNLSILTLSKIAKCLKCDIPKLTKGIPNER